MQQRVKAIETHLVYNVFAGLVTQQLLHHLCVAMTTGNVQSCVPISVSHVHKCLVGVLLQESCCHHQAARCTGIVERGPVIL